MPAPCPHCEDSGLHIVIRPDGSQYAAECECRAARRSSRLLERAQIPSRYEHCSLDNFDTRYPSLNASLDAALMIARKFVQGYPLETDGRGLLLVGSVGIGKTHLAISVLRALISERNVQGLFVDYRDLLKKVQNTYNPQVAATELEILMPVFKAEVLVLDELGASKPSEWVADTVAHILNSRYNERRTTIITTNFSNAPEVDKTAVARMNEPQKAMYKETLGDRIGERMRSRLQEMCEVVEMQGEDFRQKVKRASFA